MKARWKRNAVVATMAVLVCAAVALNWRYTSDQAVSQMEQAQSEETGTKILGQATLVSGVEDGADDAGETDGAADGGEAVDETAVYTGSDYFASARLTRQQARDSAISLLQEAAEQENADAAVANEASEGIQVLAAYTLQEAQIENLVTAKGYQDCVAFLGEDGVSVVVATDTGELTAEDVAKITDIAMSETGLPAGSVKIMAAN
ncbi:SpoIIIAH-like family protein [uncultured Oscillibacter sp.]|uniref:SpoIIIAH-like family protein n=1 Tax=uncultured Oscillibacter sp. TaxID=876091 RepID=UPI002803A390|nr:SpoIIIAH-like family protein [uncultured Oscillibacter sp.]